MSLVHESFLNQVIGKLKVDARFQGVCVAGSWLDSAINKYSDLDLVLVSEDSAYELVLADRKSIAQSFGKLLAAFTGEHVGEPRLLVTLFGEPLLHVDLKFVNLEGLVKRVENPFIAWDKYGKIANLFSSTQPVHPMPDLQWIEDRFWVWIHYAGTKLGRGELFETIDFTAYIRSEVLGPLSLVKHGHLPRGSRRLETRTPKYLGLLKQTVPSYDRPSCFQAIVAIVELYRILREDSSQGNLIVRSEAENAAVDYLESIRI